MSIREYNKDHRKEHAGVEVVPPETFAAPESGDPLIFWTRHATLSSQVNLHVFFTGQSAPIGGRKNQKFIPFTGRPKLTLQLAPVIEDTLFGASEHSVANCLFLLRAWWRVLDAVEAAAEQNGKPMARVEDVLQLSEIHSEFAHRSGMKRVAFATFRGIVNTARLALDARPVYWQTPERPDIQRHQPPEEQVKSLRFALKQEWRSVMRKWEYLDQLKERATVPDDPEEAELYHHAFHMRAMQAKYDKLLPSPDELRDGMDQNSFTEKTGLSMKTLRATVFPTHKDADAAYHLCLCNTGWNPSTLIDLDVNKKILITHPKDALDSPIKRFVLSAETYTLTGEKARSGNREQMIFGLWKTSTGPGYIIKTYLERVVNLREQLKADLSAKRQQYATLIRDGAPYGTQAKLFDHIQRLEQGCRSVWLYVDRLGEITWLNTRKSGAYYLGSGKNSVSFLTLVLEQLNAQRSKRNETLIPRVTPSDFRDFFATYVWRISGGNILAVKRALNHSHLRTTTIYFDNNIFNKEANDAARKFLSVLIGELDKGRLDLTILAHLQRYGTVTPELEQRLAEHRSLTRSRMKVACKHPYNPPPQIRASGSGPCADNRCLLCLENAVLLPESYDGIAMRVEEILVLQAQLPIETWMNADYPLELQNNLAALHLFDANLVLNSRRKWAIAIASGAHYVPGSPIPSNDWIRHDLFR